MPFLQKIVIPIVPGNEHVVLLNEWIAHHLIVKRNSLDVE
jgi:hypothetical protein